MQERRVTCELSKDISLRVGGVRAMDAHPIYPNILLICEAEGHIILFDLFLGCIVNVFEERGYHILHPQFSLIPTECRFTQDGLSFIVSTEYGSVSLYGYDSKLFYALTPCEQFLETDFTEI
jgi:bromodomain and WD repeat domain containing protein 1/3